MELTTGQTILLIVLIFFVFYTIRKFYLDPLEGTIFILKILKVIRWIIAGIVGIIYLILPIDIIPDVIIPFGWIDDIAVFLFAHSILKFITFANKLEEKKEELEDKFRNKFHI